MKANISQNKIKALEAENAHLRNLINLKDQTISELQRQLSFKQPQYIPTFWPEYSSDSTDPYPIDVNRIID
jgi:hypothetical protein